MSRIAAGISGNDALRVAHARLMGAGVASPARDARKILAFCWGTTTDRLVLALSEPMDASVATAFEAAIGQREARVPVSHILGTREFYGRPFRVTRDVLDPRPETETLIEHCLSEPFDHVLDLGTGTGCILVSLLAERPGTAGTGTDISDAALDIARANAVANGVEDRSSFLLSDWLNHVDGSFDLIVSNPPYISAAEVAALDPELRLHEPRVALTDNADGLSCYRDIATGAPAHLAPGGRLAVEIGATQGSAVSDIFRAAGLEEITVHSDLDSRDRVVSARKAR